MSTKIHQKCPQEINHKCPRKFTPKEDFSWTKVSKRIHQKCSWNSPFLSPKIRPLCPREVCHPTPSVTLPFELLPGQDLNFVKNKYASSCLKERVATELEPNPNLAPLSASRFETELNPSWSKQCAPRFQISL